MTFKIDKDNLNQLDELLEKAWTAKGIDAAYFVRQLYNVASQLNNQMTEELKDGGVGETTGRGCVAVVRKYTRRSPDMARIKNEMGDDWLEARTRGRSYIQLSFKELP